MKKAGKFNMPIPLAVQIINIVNLFACFTSGFMSKIIGQKKTMLGGVIMMTILDILIVLFNYLESSTGIIVSLVLFILSF